MKVSATGFEELVRPCVDPAFRLAHVLLGNHADAEDAVQESVTRAWRKIHQLRCPEAFRPWFLTIVANQCRGARRTRWWQVLRLGDQAPLPPGCEPEDLVARLDLRGALRRLSPEDRAALLLFYGLDLPLDEVAAALRITPGAARSRIYRAVARLRVQMAEELHR